MRCVRPASRKTPNSEGEACLQNATSRWLRHVHTRGGGGGAAGVEREQVNEYCNTRAGTRVHLLEYHATGDSALKSRSPAPCARSVVCVCGCYKVSYQRNMRERGGHTGGGLTETATASQNQHFGTGFIRAPPPLAKGHPASGLKLFCGRGVGRRSRLSPRKRLGAPRE